MGINIYKSNEEEKFTKLINDLKNLPKEKADDNFEYNLMVKIQNKNFELSQPEKRFYFGKQFVPAAALIFSTILLFFVISDSEVNLENPFQATPPVRANYSIAKTDTIVLSNPETISETITNEANQAAIAAQSNVNNVVRVVVEPSDAVTVEEVNLPFDDSNSLDLDSFVSGNRNQPASLQRGRLVGGGSQPTQFDGFLFKERPSPEALKLHKNMLDSLKKAENVERK
ncbi:MAG: hypothetical protein C4543_06910 [Ignavibacteriales bacterium]|jgi:hypothetical protein|nr:hypothetical protein [Melioribacteraceae bacterium]RJP59263.1 MAG: hypothetical protein C4543_06910 [Ignavibacteriales bacterium]